MKSRKVDTVTTTEEHIRLQIYDGAIPLGEAGNKLLELTLLEFHRGEAIRREIAAHLQKIESQQRELLTPWPVRWWRYFRGTSLS